MTDPDLTDGSYAFEQSPACGYEETTMVSNLPPFAIHNEAESDFTVPSSSDKTIVGEYLVNIRSEIQVPTDETKTSYDTWFVEYDFPLRVWPCRVIDYTKNTVAGPISQNVGAPSKNDGLYSFV